MTEDRRTLLVYIFGAMYSTRCRCGRCDCVSADPFEIAQRVFIGWSVSYRRLSANAVGRAELYRKFELQAVRSKNPFIRARRNEHATNAIREEWQARRLARGALRYERLGRGRPPFVVAEASTCAEVNGAQ